MKKRSLHKWILLTVAVLSVAILADKVAICYWEAKKIAANPAREDARLALKSLLEKTVIARPLIRHMLTIGSTGFSIEFRRRLYRQLYRANLDKYRDIILEDFKANIANRREFFQDGTLMSSFPALDDPGYQSSLAGWLASASVEEIETFYWTIQESPLENISSAVLKEESRRQVERLILSYVKEPDKTTDETLLNVGVAFEKMAHPGMAIEDSKVLAILVPIIEKKGISIYNSTIPWSRSADILIYMYSKFSNPLLKAEVCNMLVGVDKSAALKHFRSVEKSLSTVNLKAYRSILANAGVNLPGFEMDDAFRGSEPRLVMFSIYDLIELPSFRKYSAITGKAYLERGKKFPLKISMTDEQRKQIVHFCDEYQWHPGLDDAYYRCASCDVQAGNWAAADEHIFRGLSSVDTDAHPYLKMLLVNSLADSNRVPLTGEMAKVLQDAEMATAPWEIMVACNRLALGLPTLIVAGQSSLASAIIYYLERHHKVGPEMWGMSSLVWEDTGNGADEGWLHSCKRLLAASGNFTEVAQLIQADYEVRSLSNGLPAGWNDLSLMSSSALDLTRGTLMHHSLIYQIFLMRDTFDDGVLENFCPIFVNWLESMREFTYGNNDFEQFKISGREREVARWLVGMARIGKWKKYSTEDIKIITMLSES